MAYIMEMVAETWSSSVSEIDEAMQRIQANGACFILAQCEDNSYDVVLP